jgi:hypothetical protein
LIAVSGDGANLDDSRQHITLPAADFTRLQVLFVVTGGMHRM